uniref:Uncharacterized protein n=1 Tax=Panagrolaimus sp. ES5 TaxID=591445 RepID=A0AC34FUH7_9BILA
MGDNQDAHIPFNQANEIYTFRNPRLQDFSLQYPILKYIYQNHVIWKKLIKTCKFFFSSNRVYPVGHLRALGNSKWEADNEIFDSNHSFCKLWLHNALFVSLSPEFPHELSSLIPKIQKCDLRVLQLDNQNLSWDEYQFLTTSGTIEWLDFGKFSVKYSDDKVVAFDKLLKNFKDMRKICVRNCSNCSSMFELDTVKNMVQILSRFPKLRYLSLGDLPGTFDFASITDFLLMNEKIRVTICFHRHAALSPAFAEMLNNFVNYVRENPPKIVPSVRFSGLHN